MRAWYTAEFPALGNEMPIPRPGTVSRRKQPTMDDEAEDRDSAAAKGLFSVPTEREAGDKAFQALWEVRNLLVRTPVVVCFIWIPTHAFSPGGFVKY